MSNRKVVTARVQLVVNDSDLGSVVTDITNLTTNWGDGRILDMVVDDDVTALTPTDVLAKAAKSKSKAKRMRVQLERKDGAKARRVRMIPGRPSWSYRLKQAVYDWIAGDKRRTQATFAKHVGISKGHFNKMLNGLLEPTWEQRQSIIATLKAADITMHWVVAGDEKPRREVLRVEFPDGSKAIL